MVQITCTGCSRVFDLDENEKETLARLAPVINGVTYELPLPDRCYECRMKQRMAWRNDRNLYVRACDYTGKRLITMYSPESPVKVYEKAIWWSDVWSAKDFGRDYDFQRSFAEQFGELLKAVPREHSATIRAENSDYTNYNAGNKNCYMCFAGNYLEDSMYCYNAEKSHRCVDCHFVYNSTLCYELVQSVNCYNVQHGLHNSGCRDSYFIENCAESSDCALSCNLHRKQFVLLNVQYSREEYLKKLSELRLDTYSGREKARALFAEHRLKYPKRANNNISVENCVGEYCIESKNCLNCYSMAAGCEDCHSIYNGFPGLKDAYDCTFVGENAVRVVNCIASGENTYNLYFSNIAVSGCQDVYYCDYVINCKNCFGCVGMRNAEYCILNKQYTKEEYFEVLPSIIAQLRNEGIWGKFLPQSLSPFGYNETTAQVIVPMTQEQALSQGYRWSDYENAPFDGLAYTAAQIPDASLEVPRDFLEHPLVCSETGKAYKLVEQELKYYQEQGIPVPRVHPDVRFARRFAMRNGWQMFERTCAQCGIGMQTSYRKDRPEIVYCEKCYQREIY